MRTYDLEAEEHMERLATFLEFQCSELVAKLLARSCTNTTASIAAKIDVLVRELRDRAKKIAEPNV